MTRFRTLRGRLTAVAVLAALVAVAALTVAFNVLLARGLDANVESALRSRAAAASTTVVRRDGRLRVRESPDDGAVDRQVWIYGGRRALERPRADGALQRAADALAGRGRTFASAPGGEVRLYAVPVVRGGRRVGTIVTGESLEAYDRTTKLALVGSLGFAALLLAAVSVLTWVTVGRALDPVRRMTRAAGRWSESEPERRFGAERRPDELGELARTFDALLDRVAASLRHEQRVSAELSHELRTPLARVVAEVELLRRRERPAQERGDAYAAIARSAQQMSDILETLMAVARADARLDVGRSDVADVLEHVAEGRPAAARDVAVAVRSPAAPAVAGVDAEVLARIVAPLVDNAARHARSRVVLSASENDGRVRVTVADDGPGVAGAARAQIFDPGVRASADDGHRGAGLGLALARRLARAVGGDVTLAPARPDRGAEFRVDLPA
jgi:signal transduction histidine kinase